MDIDVLYGRILHERNNEAKRYSGAEVKIISHYAEEEMEILSLNWDEETKQYFIIVE